MGFENDKEERRDRFGDETILEEELPPTIFCVLNGELGYHPPEAVEGELRKLFPHSILDVDDEGMVLTIEHT